MLLKTQYRKLLDYAFVPHTVLHSVKIRDNAVGDHLLAYLCFAFEQASEENLSKKEDRIIFAPGLQNNKGNELYCCFAVNRNQKQPWALVRIDTWQSLHWPFRDMCRPSPMNNTLERFNTPLQSFAFIPHQKMEAIAPFFNGDTSSAFLYIALIYDWSNKYGYITYKKDKAVFDSGLRNGVDRVFALFLRNPQPYQPWILDGFVSKDILTDFDSLPTFVLSDAAISKQDVKCDLDTLMSVVSSGLIGQTVSL